jgi:hypothetical protein
VIHWQHENYDVKVDHTVVLDVLQQAMQLQTFHWKEITVDTKKHKILVALKWLQFIKVLTYHEKKFSCACKNDAEAREIIMANLWRHDADAHKAPNLN